jgi:RNA polymerase sigma factor (TIGR02999 family)
MTAQPDGLVTRLFSRWREGDEDAATELLPQVDDELRRLAGSYLGRERRGHTLQPTELVNEAFLRLLGSDVEALDRTHFFALAAGVIRRILVDRAHRKQAGKRFAPEDRVTMCTNITPGAEEAHDVLDLHRALERFTK